MHISISLLCMYYTGACLYEKVLPVMSHSNLITQVWEDEPVSSSAVTVCVYAHILWQMGLHKGRVSYLSLTVK